MEQIVSLEKNFHSKKAKPEEKRKSKLVTSKTDKYFQNRMVREEQQTFIRIFEIFPQDACSKNTAHQHYQENWQMIQMTRKNRYEESTGQ